MNARNEKTRREAGYSEGMVLPTPDLRGNRSEGTVLPKHLLSLRHDGACIKQNSLESLLPLALAIGALSYLHGLDSRDVAMQV